MRPTVRTTKPHDRRVGLVLAIAVLGAACGTGGDASGDDALDPSDWDAVLAAADGQTVNWWLFGGDDRINRYLDDVVAPAAADLGVTLERMPITDTADAVNRVVSEVRADETDGSVDLIWINGENFAIGDEADLWLRDWAGELPNTALLDPADPTLTSDFGTDVDGQESPWSRAAFVFAHDEEALPDPPTDFPALLAHARANPGTITYPAVPDFTGAAFVRQAVQALGEDEAFALLAELKPLQWRGGDAFPANEAELNELFSNGEVDLAMSYAPGFVGASVEQGQFPDTVRPFTFDSGSLSNVSFVTIPANAGDVAGALVVANLLLEPRLQAAKADPAVLGVPTVLDLTVLDPEERALFELTSPYLLEDFGTLLPELDVAEVERLEQRWLDEILRG